ncbi:MAG TPA: oxygen-independent coproporphyrinogen III oxidase-like protein [Xanthomonadales bacterium]|nr:oxygen-independent coproporphyrinogen III oxidase-like protein [Xanthomonadales bacterium]
MAAADTVQPSPAGRPLPPPLALYIHLPWCVRKCPYCDFNSHAAKGSLPFTDYADALIADLEQELPLVWGRTVTSVFFGGGTPSLFPPATIADILDRASALLRFEPGLEVTLETNPGTAEHGRFRAYLGAGVNRLSFGVQSFDDGCLARLGRIHDADQARRAIASARADGFDNFNIDLMYALPGQTVAMAERDIAEAVALDPSHISHYQLTLEPNTVFAARPPEGLPDDDEAWTMQRECQTRLAEAGFEHYEISAYARPGLRCRHNLNYWRFGDYLGIGAGAHGKITQGADGTLLRRSKRKHPNDYLAQAAGPGRIATEAAIAPEDRPFEFMLNALRLHEGFSLTAFEARTGLAGSTIEAPVAAAVAHDWLVVEGDRIRPTESGLRFNNALLGLFLP